MRTDPRKACANKDERLFWALVHDGVCHPLMALTCWATWTVRFHDWTSQRAWPRRGAQQWARTVRGTRFGDVLVEHLGDDIWRVHHGRVRHALTIKADHAGAAFARGMSWFDSLAAEFNGAFSPRP